MQHLATRLLYGLLLFWIGLTAFFILFYLLDDGATDPSWFVGTGRKVGRFLTDFHVLFKRPDWFPVWLNIIFAIAVLLFVKSVRKVILYLLNQVRGYLHLLPGKRTKALMARYLMMARFALYARQSGIFSRLKRQYPLGTQFVLLPMDMEFMGAGKLKKENDYYQQMKKMVDLNEKEEVHPFVFVDPRRIEKDGKSFFDYEFSEGTVTLKDCFIKTYMEDKGFAGFKIYPALGYFPFDQRLLPVWKYAADNGIPIMTHGVKGIIYYRGRLREEWNQHPVFTEYLGGSVAHQPLYFDQFKNEDFQFNFTHPMNYLCLLEEPLLRKLLAVEGTAENKALFGFTDTDTPLKYNLSKLKVCFAHYGGAEEWNRFLERDRDNYAQQLMAKPETGIHFGRDASGEMPWGRYENVWKFTDWYSIVSSMMIQYENFYADISYIVSNTELYPMLRSTISTAESFENKFTDQLTYASREILRKKVLFGSDFYVVRSQRSDKDIFVELKSYLTEEEFDLIARDNPHEYLKQN